MLRETCQQQCPYVYAGALFYFLLILSHKNLVSRDRLVAVALLLEFMLVLREPHLERPCSGKGIEKKVP
jgi:hypothetical protein